MDKIGIKDSTPTQVIETLDKSTWDLTINYLKVGSSQLADNAVIRFEP